MNMWLLPPPPGTSPLHQLLMMHQQQQQLQAMYHQQEQHGVRCGLSAVYQCIEDPVDFWTEYSLIRPPPSVGLPPPPALAHDMTIPPPPYYTGDRYTRALPPYPGPYQATSDFRDASQMADECYCNTGHMWQGYPQPTLPPPRMIHDQPFASNYLQHQQRQQLNMYPYSHNVSPQQYTQPPPQNNNNNNNNNNVSSCQHNHSPLLSGNLYSHPPPPQPQPNHIRANTSIPPPPNPMSEYRDMPPQQQQQQQQWRYECPPTAQSQLQVLPRVTREFNVSLPPPPLLPPHMATNILLQHRQQMYSGTNDYFPVTATAAAPVAVSPANKSRVQFQRFPERTYSRNKEEHVGEFDWRENARTYSEVVEKSMTNRNVRGGNKNSTRDELDTKYKCVTSSMNDDVVERRRFDSDGSGRCTREANYSNDSDTNSFAVEILSRPKKDTDSYKSSTNTQTSNIDVPVTSVSKEPANNYQINLVAERDCRYQSSDAPGATFTSRSVAEKSCKKSCKKKLSYMLDEVAAQNTAECNTVRGFEIPAYSGSDLRKKDYMNKWNFTEATYRRGQPAAAKISSHAFSGTKMSSVPVNDMNLDLQTKDEESITSPDTDSKDGDDGSNSLSSQNTESTSDYNPKSMPTTSSTEDSSEVSDMLSITPEAEVVEGPLPPTREEDARVRTVDHDRSNDQYEYTVYFDDIVDVSCDDDPPIVDSVLFGGGRALPMSEGEPKTCYTTLEGLEVISQNLMNHSCGRAVRGCFGTPCKGFPQPPSPSRPQTDPDDVNTNVCDAFVKLCTSLTSIRACLDAGTNKTQELLQSTKRAFLQFHDSYHKYNVGDVLPFSYFKYPNDIAYEKMHSLSTADSVLIMGGASGDGRSCDSGIAQDDPQETRKSGGESIAEAHQERINMWNQECLDNRQTSYNRGSFICYEDLVDDTQTGKDESVDISNNAPVSSELGGVLSGLGTTLNNSKSASEERRGPQYVMSANNAHLSPRGRVPEAEETLKKTTYDEYFPEFLSHKEVGVDKKKYFMSQGLKKNPPKLGSKKGNYRIRNCCKRRINYANMLPSKDGDSDDKDEIKDYLKPGCYAVPPTSTLSLPTFGIPTAGSSRKSFSATSSARSRSGTVTYYQQVGVKQVLPPRRANVLCSNRQLQVHHTSDRTSYLGVKPKSLLEIIKGSQSANKTLPFGIKQLEVVKTLEQQQQVEEENEEEEEEAGMLGRWSGGLQLRKKKLQKKNSHNDWLKETLESVSLLQDDVYTPQQDVATLVKCLPETSNVATVTKTVSEDQTARDACEAGSVRNVMSCQNDYQRSSSVGQSVPTSTSQGRSRRVFVGEIRNESRNPRRHRRNYKKTPTVAGRQEPDATVTAAGKGQKWKQITPGLFHTLEKKQKEAQEIEDSVKNEEEREKEGGTVGKHVSYYDRFKGFLNKMDLGDTCDGFSCGVRGCRRLIILLTRLFQELWDMEDAELIKDFTLDEEAGQVLCMGDISSKLKGMEYKKVEDFVFDCRLLFFSARLSYGLNKELADRLRVLERGFNNLLNVYFEGWDFRHIRPE